MIPILLLLLLSNCLIAYLVYKSLPKETKQEVARKVVKVDSKMVEWIPPKTGEEINEEEIRKNLNL